MALTNAIKIFCLLNKISSKEFLQGHIDDIVIQRSNSETSSLSSENRLSGLSSVSDNNDALNGGSHAETVCKYIFLKSIHNCCLDSLS